MCGSATFTIVESIAYSIVASTVAPASRMRERGAAVIDARSAAAAEPAIEAGVRARVDLDRRAHAVAQRRVAGVPLQLDAHRDALHDLDPVAGGILRRQQRELRAGRLRDALDAATPAVLAVGVDVDVDRLAGAHPLEVGLLEVRLDPDRAVGDDRERGAADLDAAADLRQVARDAGLRRADLGVCEVELRALELGERGLDLRVAVDRELRVAAEPRGRLAPLQFEDAGRAGRDLERAVGGVERRGRDQLALGEFLLALEVALGELRGALRDLDLAALLLPRGLERGDVGAREIGR